MKTLSLSEEIEKLDKRDFTVKSSKNLEKTKRQPKKTSVFIFTAKKWKKISSEDKLTTPIRKKHNNLPEIRKVAIAKRNVKNVMLIAIFVSCFSLSVFIGYFGPFLLFK